MIASVRAYLRTGTSHLQVGSGQLQRLVPGGYLTIGHRFGDLPKDGADPGARTEAKRVHYIVPGHQLWKDFRGLAFETFAKDMPNEAAVLYPLVPSQSGTAGGEVVGEVQEQGVHRGVSHVTEVAVDGFPAGHLVPLRHLAGPKVVSYHQRDQLDPSAAQSETVQHGLSAVSDVVVEVGDDDAIDLATAVHGSGPAYVYMVVESMIESGVRLGMKRSDAQRLVLATVAGAARYAMVSETAPAELRYAVTSPGGTTAAAIAELEAAGVRAAFDDAIEAAYSRAQELGE